MEWLSRSELLIGQESIFTLANSSVAIIGLGGVGSYAAEAIARCGVGKMLVVDNDIVAKSNINRQLIASNSTIGVSKAELTKRRILDINPEAEVVALEKFYSVENSAEFNLGDYDYIIDAIDSITSKIELIIHAKNEKIPIISALGAANKINPTMFEIADIYSTTICPLARVMRHELRKRGVESLKVVFSKEKPFTQQETQKGGDERRKLLGSIAFVPPVCGMIIASQVVKDLIKWEV